MAKIYERKGKRQLEKAGRGRSLFVIATGKTPLLRYQLPQCGRSLGGVHPLSGSAGRGAGTVLRVLRTVNIK